MIVQETHRNASENYLLSEPDSWQVDDTTVLGSDATPTDVYRFAAGEYGRCTGKVYVNDGVHVGWTFVKKDRYEDTAEPFLHETWIVLLDRDETVRHVDYHAIAR